MKKYASCLLSFIVIFHAFSQEIINDPGSEINGTIEQIVALGDDNIIKFQALDNGVCNYSQIVQNGNYNKVGISQQNKEGALPGNQSYTLQSGYSNELISGQAGNGNLLYGVQSGYMNITGGSNGLSMIEDNALLTPGLINGVFGQLTDGESNNITIFQNGKNNALMVVQLGSYNTISAGQNLDNNFLAILQNGNNNHVTGYIQGNESNQTLNEKIIQIGDNLSLTANDVSMNKLIGNSFEQIGSNLSIEVYNGLLNILGGIEIKQFGKDMRVVVDKSYFQ